MIPPLNTNITSSNFNQLHNKHIWLCELLRIFISWTYTLSSLKRDSYIAWQYSTFTTFKCERKRFYLKSTNKQQMWTDRCQTHLQWHTRITTHCWHQPWICPGKQQYLVQLSALVLQRNTTVWIESALSCGSGSGWGRRTEPGYLCAERPAEGHQLHWQKATSVTGKPLLSCHSDTSTPQWFSPGQPKYLSVNRKFMLLNSRTALKSNIPWYHSCPRKHQHPNSNF